MKKGTYISQTSYFNKEFLKVLGKWLDSFQEEVIEETKRSIVGLSSKKEFDFMEGILYSHPMIEELLKIIKDNKDKMLRSV